MKTTAIKSFIYKKYSASKGDELNVEAGPALDYLVKKGFIEVQEEQEDQQEQEVQEEQEVQQEQEVQEPDKKPKKSKKDNQNED